jgi:membrane-associated phospholipid phosphatase
MSRRLSLNYKNFGYAIGISLLLALLILALSFYLGRDQFFLLLNTDLGAGGDYFFQYFTHLGDGLLWIVWLAVILKTKQKQLLPLVISSFILTTIFTQVFKNFVLPNEPRPSSAISDVSNIHFVEGVTLHSVNSFPSGHTATAFTFVLLIALIIPRTWIILLAIIVASLVGYSRVYLGQHFPLDVGAGIIVAMCSVSCALLIQRRFYNKSNGATS